MKKRIMACIVLLAVIISILFSYNIIAHADALSLSVLSGTAYMLGQQFGFGFNMSGLSASQTQSWMSGNIETYADEQAMTIQDLFGDQILIDAASKLVIGHTTYNAISDFLSWLKDKYNLTAASQSLCEMLGEYAISSDEFDSGAFTYAGWSAVNVANGSYWEIRWVDENGTIGGNRASVVISSYPIFSGIKISRTATRRLTAQAFYENERGGITSQSTNHTFANDIEYGTVSGSFEETAFPTVLNPDKEWYGSLGGYDVPDTNLEQLMGQVFQDVADNNIEVDGEIIDVPIPPPTPEPIAPDTPLQDVPWEGLDTNLQNLYNQGLEEIGAIGDAQDAITDAVADQTGALEGAIADNAGVVSGAIDQAVSDIQDAISEQTNTLSESASATAEATETIAEALEDEAINWQKFDLRGLFPFCIPFDIYNMLEALDASPTAPHVQLPFVIESIGFSYTIDLDFSAFDTVAAVMRQMELIVYGIALAWATSKVIKW